MTNNNNKNNLQGTGAEGSKNTSGISPKEEKYQKDFLDDTKQNCDFIASGTGSEEQNNVVRAGLRKSRDNFVERLSSLEDKRPDSDPKVSSRLDTLIKGDSYLRAAGLDAIIDDSNNPEVLDMATSLDNPGGDIDLDV